MAGSIPGSGSPRANAAATDGLAIVGLFVLAAAAADWLPLRNPLAMVPQARMAGPSWTMPFGTDAFGRDICSRLFP